VVTTGTYSWSIQMTAVSADLKDQIALSAPIYPTHAQKVIFFVRQRVSGQETVDRAPITLGCAQYTHNEKSSAVWSFPINILCIPYLLVIHSFVVYFLV